MISDKELRRAVAELREASTGAYRHVDSLDVIANSIGVEVDGKFITRLRTRRTRPLQT